jgi:putative cardiolipin synthase
MKKLVSSAIALSLAIPTQFSFATSLQISREPAQVVIGRRNYGPLTEKEILKLSSSQALKATDAVILLDNDAAFQTKIDALDSAQPGETVRMVYYIYSDDHSSSYLSQRVLAAANRGVKIKLLLDYLTNYKNLDLFTLLHGEGRGNIDIRFYGRPSKNIVRDSLFLTRSCSKPQGLPTPTQCSSEKWAQINAELKTVKDPLNHTDFLSSLLLSGLSAKSGAGIKNALMVGQQINLADFTQDDENKTAEQKAQELASVKEFFHELFKARVLGDLGSKIKVALAMTLYASDLNPLMNQINGMLPLEPELGESGNDWDHLTDYTHHKLLMVGNRFFQLGGRNIENSYHMKKNDLSAKYTFIDTDFAANLKSGGEQIAKSFDQLFSFSPMIISLDEIQKLAPIDLIKSPQALDQAIGACVSLIADRQNLGKCVNDNFYSLGGKTREERLALEKQKMESNAQTFLSTYYSSRDLPSDWRSRTAYAISLSEKDLRQSLMTYAENLHYDLREDSQGQGRIFGAPVKREANLIPSVDMGRFSKNIHSLWTRGLENTCIDSAKDKVERQVIFHTAYLMLPSVLLRTLAKMMDGTWDCSRVTVTFLTNSFDTTDLNIINVYARYQMRAFFETLVNRGDWRLFPAYSRADKKSAQFRYLEYVATDADKEKIHSLHTKVTVLGQDLIIGSANADARSFFMDTNNAVFIRGAQDASNLYIKSLNELMKTSAIKDLSSYYGNNGGSSLEVLRAQDALFLEALRARFKSAQRLLTPDRAALALKVQKSITDKIYEDTKALMRASYMTDITEESKRAEKEAELMRKYDEMIKLL